MQLGVTAVSGWFLKWRVLTSPRSSRTVTREQAGVRIGPLSGPPVSPETRDRKTCADVRAPLASPAGLACLIT